VLATYSSRILAAAAVVTTLAAAAPRASAVELHLVDVLGNRVDVTAPAPAVLIFMSKRAKDASAAFARDVDQRLLAVPVESIGIVDVRRYGGLLRKLATSYLKRAAEDARVTRRERRQARGVDASPAAVDRWHLIGDFDGTIFGRFGVAPDPEQPLAFVLDRGGDVHGPFRDVERVVAAVSTASATP
jgi:hypothetical protein